MKKCSSYHFICLLFTITLYSSCVTLYKPNMVNTPLLKEKGEGIVSAGLGISGNGLFNVQGAYAVGSHAAVMMNGMYHSVNRRYSSNTVEQKESVKLFSCETGIGYFSKLGSGQKGLFQVYSGVGVGNSSDKLINVQNPPYIRSNHINFFIQPGLAFTDKNFDFSFDLRANYAHMFDVNGFLYTQFDWWNSDINFVQKGQFGFMTLEPVITFRVGGGKVKGSFQTGFIAPVYQPENYFAVNSSSYLLIPLFKTSFGLSYFFQQP